jgi:hypothetical protein
MDYNRALDTDGYPTGEFLEWISEYNPIDSDMSLEDFIDLILLCWHHGDVAYRVEDFIKGKNKLYISTMGWSGNEYIIESITNNTILTSTFLRWLQWNRGGHYIFEYNT